MEHSLHTLPATGTTQLHPGGDPRLTEAMSLLSQAVQESEPAVRQVGDAIERMMHALHGGLLAGEELRRTLAKDLALCVHGLQFHDRLTQQVNYARDLIGHPETCPAAARKRFPGVDADESSIELF